MLITRLEPRTATTAADAFRYALWPIAILTILQRVFIKAINGYITDDFSPVYKASLAFLNHQPVYGENFDLVDPHYLYPPSGTLLMAPLAIIDPEHARWCFIALNAVAIILAWYLILRMFKFTVSSVAAPLLLLAMFLSETVTNTLVFTNVNGCVLLAEVGFLMLLLQRRDLWAGALLGLTFAIKPTLAPLLILVLMRRQWKVFITAIAVPVALTALAWPLSKDAMDFFRRTVPYLLKSRDYYNSSIVGNGIYYGVASPLLWLLRILFAVVVIASLWLLYRYCRNDELFYITTVSGILMTASFLLLGLAQMYYSMLLFPFLMSVVLRNSVLRNWPAWLAIYGFTAYDSWLSTRFPAYGRTLDYLRVTFGWSLLLIVVFAVLGDRYLAARREGRLAEGIEPGFLRNRKEEPEKVPVSAQSVP